MRVFIVQEWCDMNLRMFLQSGLFSEREETARGWCKEGKPQEEVEATAAHTFGAHTYAAHAAREIAGGMR